MFFASLPKLFKISSDLSDDPSSIKMISNSSESPGNTCINSSKNACKPSSSLRTGTTILIIAHPNCTIFLFIYQMAEAQLKKSRQIETERNATPYQTSLSAVKKTQK